MRKDGIAKEMLRNKDVLREMFPNGTRLRLTQDLPDEFTPKKAGDVMTVWYVDDACQIHGKWESGGCLALIPGVDSFEVIG